MQKAKEIENKKADISKFVRLLFSFNFFPATVFNKTSEVTEDEDETVCFNVILTREVKA